MELSLDRLTKQYGRKIAVDCVSATLKPGVYGLLGANGAGKTTLMRMLCAVLESTSGEVLLDGKEVTSMGADYRNVLGYLPQDFGYYPNYTAMEFLMYIAALKGIPKNVAKKRVTELLEVVDLSHVANKKVKTFSGGMKQRIGIALILLHLPRILVVDEPTAGLDPRERIRFRNLLVELSKDRIVIFSTHIIEDISSSCSQVVVINKGSLKYFGDPVDMVGMAAGKVWQFDIGKTEFEQALDKLMQGPASGALARNKMFCPPPRSTDCQPICRRIIRRRNLHVEKMCGLCVRHAAGPARHGRGAEHEIFHGQCA